MIGKILGDRYELIEKIGEGGMAEVYKAKCLKLNRYNAVKILKKEFSSNKEIVEKFKREATAIANFSHPNIIGVLDVGTQDGINYIVMEYVKGKTLKQIIKEQVKIPSNAAVEIAIQIAKALECAHKNNIIHRDVKPQNILIAEDGTVKVSDFGIAKSVTSSTVAHTTEVMGSAHYFSPEQAKGSYMDERTDIYSLGIVLYEMVTGKVPFDGENAVSIALKHIQEPVVPPKNISPEIPENLNKLILKAMEKEPIKRYQSAKEILNDLMKIKNNVDFTIVNNNFDEDYTRVMAPVNVKKPVKEDIYEVNDEYEDEDEDTKSSKKKVKTIILFSLIAVLVIALGALAASLKLRGSTSKLPENVKIPEIKGLKKDEAEKKLKDAGLNMNIMEVVKGDEPEDTILDVSPSEGMEVKRNSTVNVKISGGVPTLKAPKLVEFDINAAKQILQAAQLEVGNTSYEYSDDIAKDIVMKQSPEPGTDVKKGSKIDLVISKGKQYAFAKVPNVVGKTPEEAKTLLEAVKLTLGTPKTVETNKKEEDGKVLSQSIPEGKEIKEGSSVEITVGKYVAKKIELKDLKIGEPYEKLKKKIEAYADDYDIKFIFVEPTDPTYVLDKISKTTVQEGDTVELLFKAKSQ